MPRLVKETVFVCVEGNDPMDVPVDVIKLEPESGDENSHMAKLNTDNESDWDISEGELISVNGIKEEPGFNDNEDNHNEDNDDINNQRNDSNSNNNESDHDISEAESLSIANVKKEPGYTNYEFLEDIEIPDSSTDKKVTYYKGQPESDDDYILPSSLRTDNIPKRNIGQSEKDENYVPPSCLKVESIPQYNNTEDIVQKETIELKTYKRTTRIARCVFNDCINDCIALIPRTVRRDMIIEHNIYIPRQSKVCEEHLQDQNWEDLALSNTTSIFRAEHCQDMKNVMNEFCRTNFDFENIDTVDSKLVRYWFDINKGDFKRIFNYFPKLKRLKESKTAFAVYLMYLQNTSIDRIALLLTTKENIVKRRIIHVRDLVRCNNYEEFKEMFLPDD